MAVSVFTGGSHVTGGQSSLSSPGI